MSSGSAFSPAGVFDAVWYEAVCAELDPAGCALIDKTLHWAQPHWQTHTAASGEPLAEHAAGTSRLLAGLHTDAATRAAAILASLPYDFSSGAPALRDDPIAQHFGQEIARLVHGSHALVRLGVMARDARDQSADSTDQKEMLRKMLLAMAADLRIVLMRLASRLRTLRWHTESKAECPVSFARETLDLYAPLANRLGIWQIKWEMEDLSFRYIEPERYKQIARSLEEKRVEREAFIADTIARMHAAMAQAGVTAEISGRPKHIFSIWNKMRTKSLDFSQLLDLRALRIIVADVRDCYSALGIVHDMWPPVIEAFDDYISRPKPNGYRSLHTVVLDDNQRPFEVQIRTRDMHQFAEYGMAAHWRYKEAGAKGGEVSASTDYDRQLSWMRQLLAWNADVDSSQAAIPVDAGAPSPSSDHIYVLSPQARVIELPQGATPVDFAYHLHTDLGHRCRGARVDGQMVPLNTRLATGQTVEIITTKSGGPSRDWVNPQLGFLASPRARSKVRMWFNAIELQQRITQGQALVEKELQRLGKTAINLEQLSTHLGFTRAEDLYVAVAKEEFSLRQIDAVFHEPAPEPEDTDPADVTRASRAESAERSGRSGVLVVGVDSLMTQLARCCRPAPPDPIVGFVTRGRGVSIHRTSCSAFRALAAREAERIIDVDWGDTGETLYPVDITVHAQDRSGLLRDLSEVFARLRLNVIGVNTQSRQSLAHMTFTVEVRGAEPMSRAIAALTEVAGVTGVSRR
ncbi:MAG: bifunctional (p)ppGpp synthetase/guanosine-3',5'-bis(diphosphate) 3'-pyrophosphohydrolase [Comamonadaceae bacterium]|nr:MAG: bifunctional (p)ppGpp synthetase/guanosine-3',5'-bis(diphosphate) 3'-pyrophosphohydrolase [Comamonadaceae bacterium]